MLFYVRSLSWVSVRLRVFDAVLVKWTCRTPGRRENLSSKKQKTIFCLIVCFFPPPRHICSNDCFFPCNTTFWIATHYSHYQQHHHHHHHHHHQFLYFGMWFVSLNGRRQMELRLTMVTRLSQRLLSGGICDNLWQLLYFQWQVWTMLTSWIAIDKTGRM